MRAFATKPHLRRAIGLALFLAVAGSSGCAATRARRGTPPPSGFLGDYSELREGYEAHKAYVAPDVDWASYYAIHIDSVTLWVTGKSERKSSDEERQLLTDILYDALYSKLSERFLMAHETGPQTIEIRAALTEAQGANVPLNVVTTVVPQLRVLTTLGGLALDTATVVGAATMEIEARDSLTNRRLAAAVDSRAGNKGVVRAFSKWADVRSAADFWAERVRDFLVRQGVHQRADAGAAEVNP
jgi:hypothetical protein